MAAADLCFGGKAALGERPTIASREPKRLRAAQPLAALFLLLLAAACAAPPEGIERVTLASRNYGFVAELFGGEAGRPQDVGAVLALPDGVPAAAVVPAMVLLHTSNGQGSQDWLYLRRLRDQGIAVLAIDSFTSRGIWRTVEDQTLVSSASMLADAFAGLAHLRADSRIDPRRIGVMGFSKGAIAALYSAYQPVQQRASADGSAFALHIAYYPWCGLMPRRRETTGAPILIQVGALDDLVPPEQCARLVSETRGPQGPNRMRLVVHPDALHAFDHPMLSLFSSLPISAPSPAFCALEEQTDGSFVELHGARRVDSTNLAEALAACSRPGHAGGNAAAAEAAYAEVLEFLRAAGFLPG